MDPENVNANANALYNLLDDNDEDDNAHTAAAVDAFTAVLKGDIGGASQAAATYGVAHPGNGALAPIPESPGSSVSSGHSNSKTIPIGQQQLLWNQFPAEVQQSFQRQNLQRMQQQQQQKPTQQQPPQQNQLIRQESGSTTGGLVNKAREGISFTALMPLLQPHLPPDQGQQLANLYLRFKKNEISREDFIRGARSIAGDQVLISTIRKMNQQQLQKQQQQSQSQVGQHQSQLSSSHSLNSTASLSAPSTLEASKQQQSQDVKYLVQKLQPQTTPSPSQSQEQTAIDPSQKNIPSSHPPAHPFQKTDGALQQNPPRSHPSAHPAQQTQVPSIASHMTPPEGSNPQAHALSGLSQTHLQSASVNQEDHRQDQGKGQVPNTKATAPMLLQKVKREIDTSGPSLQPAVQAVPSASFSVTQSQPLTSAAHQSQKTMLTGAGQMAQPFAPTSLPKNLLPGQTPGHAHLQVPEPGAQVVAPVPIAQAPPNRHAPAQLIPQAQAQAQAQLQPIPQAQPQPVPPPVAQPGAVKPLTKYAKQKLRKEQKKREEENLKKVKEEERLKKLNDEESSKNLQNTSIGMVMAAHAHQGLHPQPPTQQLSPIPIELTKQLHNHLPGVSSHSAQLSAVVSQVVHQQVAPIGPGGLVASEQAQSLVPVKQEPSESQSVQTLQNSAGLSQLAEARSSVLQVQSSSAEQMLTTQESLSMLPSSTLSLAQQAGIAPMPAAGLVPVPSLPQAPGVQSTLSIKQVVGQQRAGSGAPAVSATTYSTTSVTSITLNTLSAVIAPQGQTAQPANTVVATPSTKTPSKKPAVGQKKSADTPASQQPPSKKQKVGGGEPDQSIDQLNDVTAVSGVNLKEEEEQLLIGPREESRNTEAMRKIVQEEEEKLFLEKGPLQAKLSAIATRCGVDSVNDDVWRCLSMCVEERLRSMLYKLMKLSKQRCDVEKDRHKVVITSDVRRHILLLKRKAKEMLDKKLAEESERLRKLNEKKDKGSRPEVEREELKAKAQKAQQEEDDRVKANAANVAARAAVGADDMLLKWQLLAERGRQKRQGGESGTGDETGANRTGLSTDGVSATHSDRKLENGDSVASALGNADTDSQGPLTASMAGRLSGSGFGGSRMLSGSRLLTSKSARSERAITIKDVIAFLETEPQMSKSTFLYRLYERERKMRDAERGPAGNRK